jgi:hypothetical protein
MSRIASWLVPPFEFDEEVGLLEVEVANASVGVNTVLWNIDWEEGDVIVGCESL